MVHATNMSHFSQGRQHFLVAPEAPHTYQIPHIQHPGAQSPSTVGPHGLVHPFMGPVSPRMVSKSVNICLDHDHEGDTIGYMASHVKGIRPCPNRGLI